jgi:hypothetical protein
VSAGDEIPDNVIAAWPNCVAPDCQHKACASKNSIYCGPHTVSWQATNSAPEGYFAEFRAAQRREEVGQ